MSDNARAARVVGREELYRGFVSLERTVVELQWRGRSHRMVREIHDHGHVAAIVPVDPVRRTAILVRQFRVSPFLDGEDGWLWEIPGGLLDGQLPGDCAVREAHEEAGIVLSDVQPLGVFWMSPGIVKERVHLFWGRYCDPPPKPTGGLDHENEVIEVHELPLAEIGTLLSDGRITDAKSALALYRLRALHGDLFAS